MRILLILVVLLGLLGCRKGDSSEALSTDKRVLRYGFSLTRDTVTVTCGLPVGWQTRSAQEWIVANKLDNKRLEIVVQTNNGNEDRNGYVEISAGGMGITLLVFQNYDPAGQPLQTSDSLALVALYNATRGENWRFKGDTDPGSLNKRWNFAKPIRTWTGVECYREQGQYRVRSLTIEDRGAVGALPPQMANLTALKVFHANYNSLRIGSLHVLSKLETLKTLEMGNNNMGGAISELSLTDLSGLEELNLSNNGLSGVLPDFSKFSELRSLSLDGNKLTESMDAVRALRNLEVLRLSHNFFSGEFPRWLGELEHLRVLDLSNNAFSGDIPSNLGHLEDLEWLGLGSCGLSGMVPAELGNLRRLVTLQLNNNSLTEIPDGAIVSPVLKTLTLDYNKLTKVGSDLGSLTSLHSLSLSNNQLTRIEGDLSGLKSIENLDLTNNLLTALPIGTMKLTTLKALRAANNRLAVVPSIFGLTDLERVNLENNQMTGQIPEGLSELTKLTNLDLSNNYLIGTIPGSLVRCSSLRVFGLSGNNLSGALPPEVVSDKRWNNTWSASTNICPQRGGYTFTNCGHAHRYGK